MQLVLAVGLLPPYSFSICWCVTASVDVRASALEDLPIIPELFRMYVPCLVCTCVSCLFLCILPPRCFSLPRHKLTAHLPPGSLQDRFKITNLYPVQEQALRPLLERKDVVAKSRTGTEKNLFGWTGEYC